MVDRKYADADIDAFIAISKAMLPLSVESRRKVLIYAWEMAVGEPHPAEAAPALGSSPLAKEDPLVAMRRTAELDAASRAEVTGITDAMPGAHPPTTGADGEDLLHISESMRVRS